MLKIASPNCMLFITILAGCATTNESIDHEHDSVGESPDNRRIEWNQAIEILQAGVIVSVSQFHNLDVILIDESGGECITKQPKIDDVLHIVEELRGKGIEITVGTE